MKQWLLAHRSVAVLSAVLVVVLLTMVPAVREYELVDQQGNGLKVYQERLCTRIENNDARLACCTALEMMFSEQFALNPGLFITRKRPLIPGIFGKKKVYGFAWSADEFRPKYVRMLVFLRTEGERYKRLWGASGADPNRKAAPE